MTFLMGFDPNPIDVYAGRHPCLNPGKECLVASNRGRQFQRSIPSREPGRTGPAGGCFYN